MHSSSVFILQNLKGPTLKANVNKVLLKGTACLKSYKWTGGNISKVNTDHKQGQKRWLRSKEFWFFYI